MSNFKIMSAAPVWVGDIDKARAVARVYPAIVSDRLWLDIVEKYGKDGGGDIPQRLTDYIEGRKGYDYRHHADINADHLGFIKNDIVDSFGILGPVEQHAREAQAA